MWRHFKSCDNDQRPNSCKFIPLTIEAQIMGLDLSQKSIIICYAIFSQDNMHCSHFIQKSYIVFVHMANSFYVAIFLIKHMIGPPLPYEKHQTISCQIHPILPHQLLWRTYFSFTCWKLWIARNERIFKNQSRTQHSLLYVGAGSYRIPLPGWHHQSTSKPHPSSC